MRSPDGFVEPWVIPVVDVFLELLPAKIASSLCPADVRSVEGFLECKKLTLPTVDLELVSWLVLELLNLWLTIEDDDEDMEDQSLIELAGDTLDETLVAASRGERVDRGFLFSKGFDEALGMEPGGPVIVLLLLQGFLLAIRDLAVAPDDKLLELSLDVDDLVDCTVPVDEEFNTHLDGTAGFGNIFLARTDTLGGWVRLTGVDPVKLVKTLETETNSQWTKKA